ncbi:hypothetical protein TUM12370_12490 [Salmonella enterica subsp. enterica serovar Choleraesuis]|nr:hypothetical protein TUM12370_12490 [Salmonella enterica subsp. enterica serovar Choleraesuis]
MSVPKLERSDYQSVAEFLSDYLAEQHELELGQFEVEFLLDALIGKLAPLLYNRGLDDALEVVQQNALTLEELLDLKKVE